MDQKRIRKKNKKRLHQDDFRKTDTFQANLQELFELKN